MEDLVREGSTDGEGKGSRSMVLLSCLLLHLEAELLMDQTFVRMADILGGGD